MIDLSLERMRMVRDQIEARGVRNAALLEAMRRVPREAFIPENLREFAYQDTPLPIESGQTISQPYIVALMIESVEPRRTDRALEIGTGSGYAAAVLSQVVDEVYSVERHEELANLARRRFTSLAACPFQWFRERWGSISESPPKMSLGPWRVTTGS